MKNDNERLAIKFTPTFVQFAVYVVDLAQPLTFEVRDWPILLWVVTSQFEFEAGHIPVALDFDESNVQPCEGIVGAGLSRCLKMTDSRRARSAKPRARTIDTRDESRTFFDKKLGGPAFKGSQCAGRELVKLGLASPLPVDAERIPYVDVPRDDGDTLVGMSLLMCMQQAEKLVASRNVRGM